MKTKLNHLIWFWGFTILLVGRASAQTPSAMDTNRVDCLLLTAEGKVEVARAGRVEWNAAATNTVLQVNDRVRTGLRSRATIRLSNLSVLRVNQLTTLQIQPPPAPGKQAGLNLESGAIYFFHRDKPGELEFRTPLASGAIRGTEFHLAVADDGRTVLTLLDGEVELSNAQGRIPLTSGEQGIVEPGKAPTKTAVIEAINIIQWSLYYPGVLDVDELALTADEKQTLADSLSAYRSGDLLGALANYPETRQPASDAERIYRAALLLAVGQVEQTETALRSLQSPSPLADALRLVIAAVKFQPRPSTLNPPPADRRAGQPSTASEWVAESYYQQSRSKLEDALKAARSAVVKSPNFGFARVRVAELEFGFGRVLEAQAALDEGLRLSPRNAAALSLKGFLLSAQNKIDAALEYFEQAIAVDGALGNAWLGRGLCRIRKGEAEAGRQDLQTAATLEPNRAVLRSYLGKAFSNANDYPRARQELDRSKQLDPNDPTSWLYSALLSQQQNEINEAIRDLEKSQELNDNRSVFRSRLLLDQDRAVRSANLAAIYKDAGMTDVSVREAARAVNYDYANFSAHLFLANSFDALRDPKQINLRYETAAFSELLVANLLAPVGAGSLSQNVSQQEYARLFDGNHLGIISSTEYFSSGDWIQYGSQYGNLGSSSYALDAYYRSENGQRPNNDLQRLEFSAKIKQQLTPQDSVLFQAQYYDFESGDVFQYYDQASASRVFRLTEKQEPNIFLGYHHEWAPGSHTLLLAGRLDDTLTQLDPLARALAFRTNAVGTYIGSRPRPVDLNYRSELTAYSVDLQQIWQQAAHTLIFGARYQTGDSDTSASLHQTEPPSQRPLPYTDADQDLETDLQRVGVYAYHQWQIFRPLRLTTGISYDRLHYPRNIETAPITDAETHKDKVSPKVGLLITPWENTHLRGAYTRSLGGVFFDNSVRLEPSQIAGFNQAFRSLIPESVVGLVPGTEFETWSAGVDHSTKWGLYLGVEGELLESAADRTLGNFAYSGFTANPATPTYPAGTQEQLDFREKSLTVSLNQLIGQDWSLGARYRLSQAELSEHNLNLPVTLLPSAAKDLAATLQQLNLFVNYTHRCGFFSQVNSVWAQQSNAGYATDIPGDDFWQFNFFAGYRFLRRAAEVRLGVLNLTDRDYRLNPLNLYYELPRERTFTASFRFYF